MIAPGADVKVYVATKPVTSGSSSQLPGADARVSATFPTSSQFPPKICWLRLNGAV